MFIHLPSLTHTTMPSISQITLDGQTYDLKDKSAEAINKIDPDSEKPVQSKVLYDRIEEQHIIYTEYSLNNGGLVKEGDWFYATLGRQMESRLSAILYCQDSLYDSNKNEMQSVFTHIYDAGEIDDNSRIYVRNSSSIYLAELSSGGISMADIGNMAFDWNSKYVDEYFVYVLIISNITGGLVFDEKSPLRVNSQSIAEWANAKFAQLADTDALKERLDNLIKDAPEAYDSLKKIGEAIVAHGQSTTALQSRLDKVAVTVSKGTYKVNKQAANGLWYDSLHMINLKAGQNLYRVTSTPGDMLVLNASTLAQVADLYNTPYTPASDVSVYLGGESHYSTESTGSYRVKQTKTLEEAIDILGGNMKTKKAASPIIVGRAVNLRGVGNRYLCLPTNNGLLVKMHEVDFKDLYGLRISIDGKSISFFSVAHEHDDTNKKNLLKVLTKANNPKYYFESRGDMILFSDFVSASSASKSTCQNFLAKIGNYSGIITVLSNNIVDENGKRIMDVKLSVKSAISSGGFIDVSVTSSPYLQVHNSHVTCTKPVSYGRYYRKRHSFTVHQSAESLKLEGNEYRKLYKCINRFSYKVYDKNDFNPERFREEFEIHRKRWKSQITRLVYTKAQK